MEQAQHVTGQVLQCHTLRELGFDIGAPCAQQVRARRGLATEQRSLHLVQHVGLVVRRAADHHAIAVLEVLMHLRGRGDAAVDRHRQFRSFALEPVGPVVAQRRDLAVLLRRQALQPGLARVHEEHVAAGGRHGIDEGEEEVVILLLVHAQTALHGDRDVDGIDHRRHALCHQRGLLHQAGTETPRLHAVGRAANVEIHLVVAPVLGDTRRVRQVCRLAAAQLHGDGVLHGIETQQPITVAMDHRLRMHHLGIQARIGRQQPVEHAAMRICPVHHRGNRKTHGRLIARFFAQIQ